MSQNQLPNCQHAQNTGNPYPMGYQGPCGQNYFGQPMQQDPFAYNHQQQNPCPCIPVSSNSCACPPQSGQQQQQQQQQQAQTISCNSLLPQNILEQIRTCVGNTTSPIFILPSGNNNPAQQYHPQVSQVPTQAPMNQGFPSSMGYPNPPSNIFPSPCYPYPIVLPVYDQFSNQSRQLFEGSSVTACNCCGMRNGGNGSSSPPFLARGGHHGSMDESENGHRCSPGSDDTICTKANCPSSINLQALASQFLSMQGVIPCAATRLILKKVSGSNVTTSVEETMERAQKSIAGMNRDQLIAESRNAQQVNGLINLHMISKPPANIVPVLTMLQLKMNSLKALVENLVNKSIAECQSFGAEATNCALEPLLLTTKSDGELRELLGTLRQRECEERVNLNYAPYHSQRVVAEGRLANIQSKIGQVEAEMERRRAAAMPWMDNSSGKFSWGRFCCDNFNQGFDSRITRAFNPTFNASQLNDASALAGFESPSPFTVQLRNPKRLNLKPNVGCPQTINDGERNTASPEAFAVKKLEEEEKKEKEKEKEKEMSYTAESRSNIKEDDVGGKKKLRIHVDTRGDLSVSKRSMENLEDGESLQLSPADVVIVIDKGQGSQVDKNTIEKRSRMRINMKNKTGGKIWRKKSPGSVKSDSSTQRSEVSTSSSVGAAEGEEKENEEENDRVSRSSAGKKDEKSKLAKNITKNDKEKKTSNKDEDELLDVREFKNFQGEEKNKKDKHVKVAMITELRYDNFNSQEKFKNHGSGSILHSDEQLPINDYEDCSQSSLVEEYDDDDDDDDDDNYDDRSTVNAKEKRQETISKKHR